MYEIYWAEFFPKTSFNYGLAYDFKSPWNSANNLIKYSLLLHVIDNIFPNITFYIYLIPLSIDNTTTL